MSRDAWSNRRRGESYLSTQAREPGGRALAALVALKAHMDLFVLYAGGYGQFRRISRPIYRNYGLTDQDIDEMWVLLTRWIGGDPSPLIRHYLGPLPLVEH